MSLSKKERKVQYLEVLSLLRKDDLDGAYNALALMCGQDTDLFILAPRTKNPKVPALPWSKLLSEGWRIVGMNHYNLAGETHLFCSMTKGEKCITSEGTDEAQVFRDLETKAGFGLEESVPESEPGPDSVPQHKGVYER